jgi:hypothetical protein
MPVVSSEELTKVDQCQLDIAKGNELITQIHKEILQEHQNLGELLHLQPNSANVATYARSSWKLYALIAKMELLEKEQDGRREILAKSCSDVVDRLEQKDASAHEHNTRSGTSKR